MRTSRIFPRLRQCRLVVASTALSFAGLLPTVRYRPAVALISYLFDRSHSWYAAFLKIFVLVQGTCTLQVHAHVGRIDAGELPSSVSHMPSQSRQPTREFDNVGFRTGAPSRNPECRFDCDHRRVRITICTSVRSDVIEAVCGEALRHSVSSIVGCSKRTSGRSEYN